MTLEPCISRTGDAHHEWRTRLQGTLVRVYCVYCLQDVALDKGREAMKEIVEAQSRPPMAV